MVEDRTEVIPAPVDAERRDLGESIVRVAYPPRERELTDGITTRRESFMLVLSRKSNESIIIGDNIRVTVASIRGRIVRIGIEAPEDVGILREELLSGSATVPTPAAQDAPRPGLANVIRRSVVRVGGREDGGAIALDS
jgi:carbon storage regulator